MLTIRIPHDWTIKTWPADIYPYSGDRARKLVRLYQPALLAAGALTRIGREIVALGAGYSKCGWRRTQSGSPNSTCPPTAPSTQQSGSDAPI